MNAICIECFYNLISKFLIASCCCLAYSTPFGEISQKVLNFTKKKNLFWCGHMQGKFYLYL